MSMCVCICIYKHVHIYIYIYTHIWRRAKTLYQKGYSQGGVHPGYAPRGTGGLQARAPKLEIRVCRGVCQGPKRKPKRKLVSGLWATEVTCFMHPCNGGALCSWETRLLTGRYLLLVMARRAPCAQFVSPTLCVRVGTMEIGCASTSASNIYMVGLQILPL